jgi:hypothetical protein
VPPRTRSRHLARRHRLPLLPAARETSRKALAQSDPALGARITADRPAVLVRPEPGGRYCWRVAELESALKDPELRGEAIEAIRSMIGTIGVVSRAESGASLAAREAWRGFWRCAPETQKPHLGPRWGFYSQWLRGQDLNLRPSGYEPDELPGCSTPRRNEDAAPTKSSNAALCNSSCKEGYP